jgi:hypothetical protein
MPSGSGPSGSGLSGSGPGDYWRAVALLEEDRRAGLAGLAGCFAAGAVPTGLSGPLRGRLLTTTLGPRADPVAAALARAWMPWRGKTFDADGGANLLTAGGRRAARLCWPAYAGMVARPDATVAAFRFRTSTGPSAVPPGVDVLRLDYRDVEENPQWPVRRILDELVAVGPGLYLGQALLHWRGRLRRAAWFSLER